MSSTRKFIFRCTKARLFIFIRNKILKKQKKKKTSQKTPKREREGGGGSECWFRRVPGPGQDFSWDFFLQTTRFCMCMCIYIIAYKRIFIEGGIGVLELFLVIFIQNGAILGNSNGYTCLDIMPQQEGRLPIYLIRDVQHTVIYINLIHCICRY